MEHLWGIWEIYVIRRRKLQEVSDSPDGNDLSEWRRLFRHRARRSIAHHIQSTRESMVKALSTMRSPINSDPNGLMRSPSRITMPKSINELYVHCACVHCHYDLFTFTSIHPIHQIHPIHPIQPSSNHCVGLMSDYYIMYVRSREPCEPSQVESSRMITC